MATEYLRRRGLHRGSGRRRGWVSSRLSGSDRMQRRVKDPGVAGGTQNVPRYAGMIESGPVVRSVWTEPDRAHTSQTSATGLGRRASIRMRSYSASLQAIWLSLLNVLA